MIRNILAVFAAFIAGGIFVTGIEALSHVVYPLPEGLGSTYEALTAYVMAAPVGAILLVLLAQSAGSFVGGLVTALIAVNKRGTAGVYGLIALFMAALNVGMIGHPLWFTVASLILPIPLALAGSAVGQRLFSRASA